MNLILLHGVTGIWDEVACLAIPATAILGVALAVLREKPAQDDGDAEAGTEAGAGEAADLHDPLPDRHLRSEG
ncbi:MAG TPA: hypothetical protein VIL85_01775 [Thermomicrobiales bacterium]